MSLDLNKLEKVRELGGGIVQARCPACAEGGHDRSGEHLRIYPDGRFGCCVHPKDGEHRKRVFALAGAKKRPGTFTVRVKGSTPIPAAQSVKAALTGSSAGTLGTAKTESETTGKLASQASQDSNSDDAYAQSKYIGTLGTALFQSRAGTREEQHIDTVDFQEQLKDWKPPVPSVPESLQTATPKERLPYITPAGDLVIPFSSPERYHWWKGGQSVAQTRAEALARCHSASQEQQQRMNDTSEF